jgi:4-diphosphocytidyl-2-C-methyl-D-erythritol kinase
MQTDKYYVKCPAKINIGLHILSNRSDGYHNIETIFYPVRIFDEMTVEISNIENGKNEIAVKTDAPRFIPAEKNICYKTALLFLTALKRQGAYRIRINIEKNIPVSAGLGGGSSDAASLLKILAYHFRRDADDMLLSLIPSIGSDVTYFFSNYKAGCRPGGDELPAPAYAESKGELLHKLAGFRIDKPLLIVCPPIHISTAWAYRRLKLEGSKPSSLMNIKNFTGDNLNLLTNDFEEPVFNEYPAIRDIKIKMYDTGAIFSSMSGSGSSIYGVYEDKDIENAYSFFKKKGLQAFKS